MGAQSTLTRLRGRQPIAQGTVTRVRGTASPNVKGVVTRIRGKIAAGMTVDAGTFQTVEPFETVQLEALVSSDSSQPATWAWTQTAGPAVTIVPGLDGLAQFKAPGLLTTTSFTFQIRATLDGFPDAVDTTTITVRAHTHFRYSLAGVLVGIEGIATAGYGPDQPPATGGLGTAPLGTSPLGV